MMITIPIQNALFGAISSSDVICFRGPSTLSLILSRSCPSHQPKLWDDDSVVNLGHELNTLTVRLAADERSLWSSNYLLLYHGLSTWRLRRIERPLRPPFA